MKFTFIVAVILALSGAALGLKDPICGEEPGVVGLCKAGLPMFTYYPDSNVCEMFIYGGCRGSHNRFGKKEDCEAKCKDYSRSFEIPFYFF